MKPFSSTFIEHKHDRDFFTRFTNKRAWTKISFKKPSLFLSVRKKLLWFFLFVFSLLKNTVLITSFTEQGFWVMSISSFRWLDHRFYGNFCFEAKALLITIKVRLLAHTDSDKIDVTGSQLALFNQVHLVDRKMLQMYGFDHPASFKNFFYFVWF